MSACWGAVIHRGGQRGPIRAKTKAEEEAAHIYGNGAAGIDKDEKANQVRDDAEWDQLRRDVPRGQPQCDPAERPAEHHYTESIEGGLL